MSQHLDETAVARAALQRAWLRLAPVVDDALALKTAAAANPALLSDPWVDAQIRWLGIFERELAAIQAVYRAAERRSNLSQDDYRAALSAARKLRRVIERAQVQVCSPPAAVLT